MNGLEKLLAVTKEAEKNRDGMAEDKQAVKARSLSVLHVRDLAPTMCAAQDHIQD